jgi:hypothetical protein
LPMDRNLIAEFFVFASRIEYGLKQAGYRSINRHNGVQPNWDRFSRAVSQSFSKHSYPELLEACEYYLNNPPDEQVEIDGMLTWSDRVPDFDSEAEHLIYLVKRVRNNLFHGGKSNPQGAREADRNTKLLRYGLVILREIASLEQNVQQAMHEAAI